MKRAHRCARFNRFWPPLYREGLILAPRSNRWRSHKCSQLASRVLHCALEFGQQLFDLRNRALCADGCWLVIRNRADRSRQVVGAAQNAFGDGGVRVRELTGNILLREAREHIGREGRTLLQVLVPDTDEGDAARRIVLRDDLQLMGGRRLQGYVAPATVALVRRLLYRDKVDIGAAVGIVVKRERRCIGVRIGAGRCRLGELLEFSEAAERGRDGPAFSCAVGAVFRTLVEEFWLARWAEQFGGTARCRRDGIFEPASINRFQY